MSPSTRSTRTSATSTPSSVPGIALPPFDTDGSCGSSRPGAREQDHRIPASPARHDRRQDGRLPAPPFFYTSRIKVRLGATVLPAFPSMESEVEGSETVLTGLLEDR